jgi:hypothetical protein
LDAVRPEERVIAVGYVERVLHPDFEVVEHALAVEVVRVARVVAPAIPLRDRRGH